MNDPRYYRIDYHPEDHRADLERSIERGDVVPVCDEQDGIIAYALGGAHADDIVKVLNDVHEFSLAIESEDQ